jgi:hypothetical protein
MIEIYLSYLCQDKDEQREECTRVACCAFLWFLFINNRKKPFCFFVASLLFSPFFLLARFPLCVYVCVCVCPLFYFLLQEIRDREQALLTCSLARLCCFSLHPLLDYYYHHTSRLLLTLIIYVFSFCFSLDFFLKIILQKMIMRIWYKFFLLSN